MSDVTERKVGPVIAVLGLCGTVVSLMQTLVIPLLPDFPKLLGTSVDNTSWLVTITLLTGAVSTPIVSKLADMVGKRRMMLVCLAALVVGSVVGALSSSLIGVIIARGLQGMAVALIPIGISIMRDELPGEKVGSAVALMSATLGIGAAVGLPLGGILYNNFDWHSLFWVSASMAVLMTLAIVFVVPESSLVTRGRFDLVGAILLSIALTGLLLAISKGGHWGWTSPPTMIAFAIGALTLAGWVPWELRASQPLVDIRTSTRRPVLVTNLASIVAGFAMFGNMLATTQELQLPRATGAGFGLTATQAGLGMVPGGLAMVLLAPVSAGVTRRFGARTTLILGALIMAATYFARVFISGEIWHVIVGAALVSVGTAVAYAAMPILIMRFVPITETAAANGLNTLLRSVGTSTSSAVVAAILASYTVTVAGRQLPGPDAFRGVFLACGAAAVLAAIAATLLPSTSATKVRADGTAPTERGVVKPSGKTKEIVVRGRVARPDGRPMRHAVVSVLQLSGEQADWARTDNEGGWSVAVPEAGRYLLICSADGWAPCSQVFDLSGDRAPIEFTLADRLTLAGVVSRDGLPVAEALVAVTTTAGESAGSARTEEDGHYSLPLPPTGRYIVTVLDVHDGVAESEELIVSPQRRRMNFVLGRDSESADL